jgi:hypothetical protein
VTHLSSSLPRVFTRALGRACWLVSVLACLPTLPLAVVVVVVNALVARRRRPRLFASARHRRHR